MLPEVNLKLKLRGPYLVKSNVKCRVSLHLGTVGKWAQVPDNPGNCFLASPSNEGMREEGREPLCV